MKLIDIKSETGNYILHELVNSDGWRFQSQYEKSAFDKGIDFDSYRLIIKYFR